MKSIGRTQAQQHIPLHFSAPEELTLTADQSLLTRLLLNLTENAVKYGKDGGDVWVEAHREGTSAVLMVRDNGIGIPAEQLPYVFERFYRADARDRSGTGLGLSIAQWSVKLHGGTLRVESEAERGTVFTVEMPIEK